MDRKKFLAFVRKTSARHGVPNNLMIDYFFLERFVARVSQSKYQNNFIMKGGFLLSNLVSLTMRSTSDLDFYLKGVRIEKENLTNVFNEILANDPDGFTYEITDISVIRELGKYNGFRVSIKCMIEKFWWIIRIDVSTGDIITPSEYQYNFRSNFNDDQYPVLVYPTETMIAEKIHAIHEHNYNSTRFKDFYDLYIYHKVFLEFLNFPVIKQACINTFGQRNEDFVEDKIITIFETIITLQRSVDGFAQFLKRMEIDDIPFSIVIASATDLLLKIKSA